MELLKKKLSEPTTWLGLLSIVGGIFGFVVSPELAVEIAAAAAAAVGAILVYYKQRQGE